MHIRWHSVALLLVLLSISLSGAADDAVAGPVVKLEQQESAAKTDQAAAQASGDALSPPPPGNTSSSGSTTEDFAKCVRASVASRVVGFLEMQTKLHALDAKGIPS